MYIWGKVEIKGSIENWIEFIIPLQCFRKLIIGVKGIG